MFLSCFKPRMCGVGGFPRCFRDFEGSPTKRETSPLKPEFGSLGENICPYLCYMFIQICGKAELCLLVVSCCSARFTRISPEVHRNFIRCSPEFARISNWSTLKTGIATTRPSHIPNHMRCCCCASSSWLVFPASRSAKVTPRCRGCPCPNSHRRQGRIWERHQ